MSQPDAIRMVDRISTLSDEVLCHILSFLPTKQVIPTCILSKRWRYLWRSVPALRFEHEFHEETSSCHFIEFVTFVLLLRDPMQHIKRFRLIYEDYGEHCEPSIVNKWVRFVLQRGVEDLHLAIICPNVTMPKFPIPILSCKTLVVLKLQGCGFDMDVPSIVLPCLKVLRLLDISFPRIRNLIVLLSGCPILEDLQGLWITCEEETNDSLNLGDFKSLSLPKLIRAYVAVSSIVFPLKVFCSVEFLHIEIEKVHYYDIPTFHNLTHMDLILLVYDWHLLVELLKNCPKLENLVIHEDDRCSILAHDNQICSDPEHVPECLSLHLRTCTFKHFRDLEHGFLLARYILKNARVLQTMTIFTKCGKGKSPLTKELSLCPRKSATCQVFCV